MKLVTEEVGVVHTDAVAYESGHWFSYLDGTVIKCGKYVSDSDTAKFFTSIDTNVY